MTAAADRVRTVLRRSRGVWRAAGVALDLRRELGWRAVAARALTRHGEAREPDLSPPPEYGAQFDVIYAIGYWAGEPKRYRVFNMAEGLRQVGYRVHIVGFDRLADIARQRWRARTLVLFRAEFDALVGLSEVFAHAREIGMRIVYDIDDLVFDEKLVPHIDGLRALGPHQRRRALAAMRRRRRLLLACDAVTASTAPIARAASALGRPGRVLPNTLNGEQLRLAAALLDQPRRADGLVRIGYFSGTPTHQRDFAVCEPALFEAMGRYPHLRLRLVGFLDLASAWQRYADRIERIGFVRPDELLRQVAAADLNLAPLEIGNPFCEAKSELKFFEAAAVEVPTIASATESFAAAIEHGVSGFLAADETGWRAALDAAIASEDFRRSVGRMARVRALGRYSLDAVVPAAADALGLDPVALPNRRASV